MRRAAKVDANQQACVQVAKGMGASVQYLHRVGEGCPDLLIGWRRVNLLTEIKDGDKSPSARKLTPQQRAWHGTWRGAPVHVIESPDQMYELLMSVQP